jgi:phage/plasmid-like protein (TIGR03299 family)
MSQETTQWLNQNVLVGYGVVPWHFDQSEQGGEESNLYDGAVPVDDVKRRLFNFGAIKVPNFAHLPSGEILPVERGRGFSVVRTDTNTVLGTVGSDYQIHDYPTWLVENVETILDADLAISSAGLLRGGALAWVAVSLPHTLQIADLEYRPQLVACTSLNGSTVTSYRRSVILPICDNTLAASLADDTDEVRIPHSSKSLERVGEIRDTLKVLYAAGDEFAAQVDALTTQKVTDRRFDKWAEAFSGVKGKAKEDIKGQAANKIEQLSELWYSDPRVAPWKGNAFGVLQTANTWMQHFQNVRTGVDHASDDQKSLARFQRTQEQVVRGQLVGEDRKALAVLAGVR